MKNLPSFLQNKKVLIIAGVAFTLIITAIFVGVTAFHSQQSSTNLTVPQSTNTTNSIQPQTNNITITNRDVTKVAPTSMIKQAVLPNQSITQFSVKDWILSDNDVYTFQYPTDWKLERTLFTNGQTIAIIQQNKIYSASTPTWSITITKTDPADPISNKEKLYQNVGFRNGSSTISGQAAVKLSGTFPPNSTAENTVQETNIYLARDNYSYIISYKYPGDKLNQQYEDLFQKITNTISIEY